MQIQEEKQGSALIVTISDHLDSSTAAAFEARLLSAIARGEDKVLVDCELLKYVNSAGLKVFLLAAKKLEAVGGTLAVCALAPSVLMIFEMIGFTQIMKVVPTREEGLRLVGGHAAPV